MKKKRKRVAVDKPPPVMLLYVRLNAAGLVLRALGGLMRQGKLTVAEDEYYGVLVYGRAQATP